jgi:hypothetical protein
MPFTASCAYGAPLTVRAQSAHRFVFAALYSTGPAAMKCHVLRTNSANASGVPAADTAAGVAALRWALRRAGRSAAVGGFRVRLALSTPTDQEPRVIGVRRMSRRGA